MSVSQGKRSNPSCRFDIKQLCVVPPPYGGVTVHVSRLMYNLTKAGLLVGAYYSEDNDDPMIKTSPLFDKLQWDGNVSPIRKAFRHIERLFTICRQCSRYKVVHSHSGLEDMLLIWLLRRVCGKKVIITVHNAMTEEYYGVMPSLNRFFLKKNADSDIRWIAVSQQAKENLLRLPLNFRNEIEVIPAYIPGTLNLSKPLPLVIEQYISSHSKIIAFYGHSFMLHNGQDVYGFTAAIDLYERLLQEGRDDVGMVLCIQEISDTEKVKELHDYARNHHVDDRICWQEGPLDNMLCLWHRTDVYVRPTSTDGDSVAVREILDMGARVVASDVCPRPQGVCVYRFGNDEDFYHKTISSLDMDRNGMSQNFEYYRKLKAIYDDCLSN